ncbi:Smr/MutS family protein [bacterium]|nr:Smr/MutS family protein [bacterium]
MSWAENEDIVKMPIDGVLDLHTFQPREVKELVTDYIHECLAKGIYSIRIIHGKGTGTLKQVVHSILNTMPEVQSFRLAQDEYSGWGATLVFLNKK